jgi:hypothetical protein
VTRRTGIVATIVAAALVLTACGGGDADVAAEVAVTSVPDPADPGVRPELPVSSFGSPLPAVTVRDVVADEWVQFADILPAEQPVLLWFWAPF